jgi:hypothetical protein
VRNQIKRSLIPLFIFMVVPIALAAQQPDPAVPPQLPAEAQELITEIQQIQAQLQPIQMEALQDSELMSAQEAFGARIQAAMIEMEPATTERLARLEALAAEAQAAEASQDEEKFGQIMVEGQQLEQQLQATQEQALQQPEVAAELDTLQTALVRKIIEVDPSAEQLLERLDELDTRLAMLLGQDR